MRSTFLRLALLFACALSLEANDQTVSKNIETLELTSKVFNNTRTIRILLPPGYHDPVNRSRKYPVFYFNDGLMVFDNKEYGIRIEDIFYDLYNHNKIPFYLVVGIDNGAHLIIHMNQILQRHREIFIQNFFLKK